MRPPHLLHRLGLLVLLLAAPPLLAQSAPADPEPPARVLLANGDRLSGTVQDLAEGTLTIETSWAGEVGVDWAQVVGLASDVPVTVVLADGTRATGTLEAPGDGRLRITSAEEAVGSLAFPVADVIAVNPPDVPPVRFRGHVAVAVTSSSGNTDSRRGYAEGELVARTDRNRFSLSGHVHEAQEDGRDTASNTFARLGYDHFFGDRWYFNTQASFREDEFQDLKLRSTFGLAAGYQFSDGEAFRLAAELGASYVNDDFLDAPDDDYPAARWSLDLGRDLGGEGGIELFHVHEVLQSLESSDDTLLRTRTGLRFHLWRNLVSSLQVNYDRDESPAPGREKDDTTWLLNLGYDW